MLRPAHLLRSEKIAAHITENPVALTIVLCAAWLLLGLIGHDPWKSDEAYTFGVVYQLLKDGDWVVPMLAGEPFLDKPPLIYLTAALTSSLFSWFLPLHDAARLAAGFYVGLTFLFVALSAKELYGSNKSWAAALMLLGCGGLVIRGHQLIADTALLAGLAIGLYGLALCLRKALAGGVCLGMGLGISFLAVGLVEPVMLLVTILLLPLFSSHWRTRRYLLALAVASVVAVPWVVVWPYLLEARSPQLFAEWYWVENIQRLKGIFEFTPNEDYFYYLNVLPWFAWPAWPFAIWGLWAERRDGLTKPGIILPATAFVSFFLFLSIIGEGRDLYGMPLLLPISLLAVVSFETLQRGAAHLYYWFAIMLFTFFAMVGWFYWMAIDFGVPDRLWKHMMDMQPGYSSAGRVFPIMVALVFTIAWLVLLFNVKRRPERPVITWAMGITMIWALMATLMIRYIDTGRTYRAVFTQLAQAVPEKHGCIYSRSLGEPQRAMLDYFADITTVRLEKPGKHPDCGLLIVQDRWKLPPTAVSANWKLVWEGRRPGDKLERFRLFRHE
ncbi:MAG TPA: glycosyltransferase family 39 protein [Burkholderiales bacterium]|nr:glycosyltransferase family 39 protein [Burkholderiales bacterium]